MVESLSSASKKAGLPPGSLVHVGEVLEGETRISVVSYSQQEFEEHTVQSVNELLPYKEKDTISWVNIEGLKDVGVIEAVGQHFGIHPLVLEDILNTHQRPKFEEHDDYLFFVFKGLSLEGDKFTVNHEQISVLLLKNDVFTFKEKQDQIFEPVRQRIKNSRGHFRSRGADFLSYAILDTVVDLYFHLQDSLDEVLDSVEEELLTNPTPETLATIQRIKRELIVTRRSISH